MSTVTSTSEKGSTGEKSTAEAILRGVLWIGLALFAISWLWVVHLRLFAPAEIDGLAGLMLETVDRVRSGQPIYVAPGDGFIPLTYPPMFYWLAAAAQKLGFGGLVGLRVVSVFASFGIVVLLARTVWRRTRAPLWVAVSVGVFLASYGLSGTSHDLATPHAATAFLVVAAVVVLLENESELTTALAGVLLAAATLTKLSSLWTVVAGVVALRINGERRRALILLATAAGASMLLLVTLHLRTAGWSTYYTVWLPLQHSLDSDFAETFLSWELPRVSLLALLVGIAVLYVRDHNAPARRLLGMVILGVATSTTFSRLHANGTAAAMMPLAAVLALAAPLAAAAIVRASPTTVRSKTASLVLGLLFVQLVLCYYDPTMSAPGDRAVAAHQSFTDVVTRLEATVGETWVLSHGHETQGVHPNLVALVNVFRAEGKQLPAALETDIREGRFKAIVIDDYGRLPMNLRNFLQRHYFVAERISLTPWTQTDPTAPEWVLFPRTRALPHYASTTMLDELTGSEMMIAGVIQRARGEDAPNLEVSSRLDRMARSMQKAIFSGDDAIRDELCRNALDNELCRALWRYMRQPILPQRQADLDAYRDTLLMLSRERSLWKQERRALLDEIDCLRTTSGEGGAARQRCWETSRSPSEPPARSP